jgi:hypothetical protein
MPTKGEKIDGPVREIPRPRVEEWRDVKDKTVNIDIKDSCQKEDDSRRHSLA